MTGSSVQDSKDCYKCFLVIELMLKTKREREKKGEKREKERKKGRFREDPLNTMMLNSLNALNLLVG